MNYPEMRAAHKVLLDELESLHTTATAEDRDLTADEFRRFEEISLEANRIDLEVRTAKVAALAPTGPAHHSGDQNRDAAMRTVEAAFRAAQVPAEAAGLVQRMVDEGAPAERSAAARWVTTTGDPAYRSAFAKLVRDPNRGHMLWTEQEAAAFRAVEAFKAENRALGEGSSGGQYMVPFALDPTILLTNDGSRNPLRSVARVVQVSSSAWHGVATQGSTAAWRAEFGVVADATPTLTEPTVPVYSGAAFVPFSYELEQDTTDLFGQLANVLTDAADQLQVVAYTKGTGTGQPTGLLTSLPAGSKLASATADTIVAADIVALQNKLAPRWQGSASFLANLTTINAIGGMQLGTGGSGPLRFPDVDNGTLLRRPLNELSTMDTAGATATAGNDYVLAYGSFRDAFLIADRIGTQIQLIPSLSDPTTGRPTLSRGATMWFRTGSARIIDSAVQVLTA